MKPSLALLLLLPLAAHEALAQTVPVEGRTRPAAERRMGDMDGPGCTLTTGSGLTLSFARCAPPAAGARRTGEVEIVEYKDGDAPIRARVRIPDVTDSGLAVASIGIVDPDDDGDGIPTADGELAATADGTVRKRPGRVKYADITLRSTTDQGARTLAAIRGTWGGDLDGDGYPMAVAFQDPTGGEARMELDGCVPVEPTPEASSARAREPRERRERAMTGIMRLTLRCSGLKAEAGKEGNPFLRFIAESSNRSEGVGTTLTDTRTPPARGARGTERQEAAPQRTFILHDATLESWSVEFDPAREGTASWTLEVRVNRIEMA